MNNEESLENELWERSHQQESNLRLMFNIDFPFSGIDTSTTEVAEAGSSVTLSCTIRGVPSVVPVQWYTSNNAPISEDLVGTGVTVLETPDSLPYQTSTVSLTSDMTASDGSFVCKFTSGTFSDTETHTLDVFSELNYLSSHFTPYLSRINLIQISKCCFPHVTKTTVTIAIWD